MQAEEVCGTENQIGYRNILGERGREEVGVEFGLITQRVLLIFLTTLV